MDTLSAFLADLTPSQVERERLGNHRLAKKETFDKQAHRKMLKQHDIERARFKAQVAANERSIHAAQRRAEEQADAELVGGYRPRPKQPKQTPNVITAERLLQIAVQAAERKAS